MPDLAPTFSLILATHITLAIALFVPGLLLPFTLRSRRPPDDPGALVRLLTWVQAHGTVVIGAGLAITGLAMLAVLGPSLLRQPWLIISLATYAVAAVVLFVIQRPGLRRLQAGRAAVGDADQAAWREGARRQRYVAYGVTGAVGLIAFLMSTKPELW